MSSPTDISAATPTSHTRRITILVGLGFALIGVMALRMCIGEQFGWPSGEFADQIVNIRKLRLVAALIVGAGLAISGVSLQALLRNPLAEPYLLGLSSGAAVGVMVQMLINFKLGRYTGTSHTGALIGALASMSIVYMAGRKRGMIDPLGLLLVGVVLSTINAAIIMLLNYVASPAGLREDLARWMTGYLNETVSWSTIRIIGGLTVAGFFILMGHARAMDAASFSDSEAMSVGVNLTRLRSVLFVSSGVLAAGAVLLAGPIAFVGLVCPHVARLLLGPTHRSLLIGSALIGAILIVSADAASVGLDMGQGRLPLGIFTSTIGGLSFLILLRPYLGRGMA